MQPAFDFDDRFTAIQDRLDAALVKVIEHYRNVPDVQLDLIRDGMPRVIHMRLVERMIDYANRLCDEDTVKRTFQTWVKQSELRAA